MSLHDCLIIAVAILFFIVLPIYGLVSLFRYLRLPPAERRRRREQARSSTGGAMIGGAFEAIDKIVRPSVEHRIETEQKIVKEDEKGGE